MENGESRVKFARTRASLNAWVGMVGAIMSLDSAGDAGIYVPVTDGR